MKYTNLTAKNLTALNLLLNPKLMTVRRALASWVLEDNWEEIYGFLFCLEYEGDKTWN
jgi:hypothetical protein